MRDVLVIHHRGDSAAEWAVARLNERGLRTQGLLVEVLVNALRWEHRVGSAGASVVAQFADGFQLHSDGWDGAVLNRIVRADRARLASMDLAYAREEFDAFFASWLESFSRVVNRPTPGALGGRHRHPIEWAALAVRAGLPIADVVDGPSPSDATIGEHLVYVVGNELIGPEECRPLFDAAGRLAVLSGLSLMELAFSEGLDGRMQFVNASALPNLALGGARVADALAKLLGAGA